MSIVLARSETVARKTHTCWVCGPGAIRPGDKYLRSSNVYDGRAYTLKYCLPCAGLEGEAWGWAGETDDGYGPQDFIDWATEYRDTDPRASALLERVNRIEQQMKEEA